MSSRKKSLVDRFMEKVSPEPNGCWRWTASRSRGGYGRIRRDGKLDYAHRVAHELFIAPIPVGLWVLHICNKGHEGCANPSHLYLGTHADNMCDLVTAGSAKGERNGRAKLTDDLVREIRSSTETSRVIAARLGVAWSLISNIRLRKRWAHVTEVQP